MKPLPPARTEPAAKVVRHSAPPKAPFAHEVLVRICQGGEAHPANAIPRSSTLEPVERHEVSKEPSRLDCERDR